MLLKVVAVIQCTADDVASDNPDDTCITSLKDSGLIDNIVLAVPKLGNYKVFSELSKKWNVDLYFGSNYNVAERIYNAAKPFSPIIIIRVLLRRFYIDMDLVSTMILKLKEGFDYINLDNNVYNEIAADVCTFDAIKKSVKLLQELPDDYKSNSFRFNPWRYMEINPDFTITTLSYTKKWSNEKIIKIQEQIKKLLKDQEDEGQPVDSNEPINRYKFILQFIEKTDKVLDMACGKGGGTRIISDFAKEVCGIDYEKRYIDDANKKFSKSNLEFICGNDELLEKFGGKFDKVISTHTMEHVTNDELFLRRIHFCLKTNGELIIEVPRLAPYPLGCPLWPHHKREYTQDQLENLLEKTNFKIHTSFGANRRDYTNVENARDSFLYVCKKIE